MLLFPLATFAQMDTIEWLKTKGKIVNIEELRFRRKLVTRATVTYHVASDTIIHKGVVDLMRLPFIGSFQSVGDEVNVVYAKKQALLIRSGESDFIQKYGLYLLIFLGVVISTWRVKKMIGAQRRMSKS